MTEQQLEIFIGWAKYCHESTNHLYADIIPYGLHLAMVAKEVKESIFSNLHYHKLPVETQNILIASAWGHDLIEDARVSYNDILSKSCKQLADIIYACTNEKGKNRSERANDKYYQGIRDTPFANLIKICDRIANVKFGKLIGDKNNMLEVYERENEHFIKSILTPRLPSDMIVKLNYYLKGE